MAGKGIIIACGKLVRMFHTRTSALQSHEPLLLYYLFVIYLLVCCEDFPMENQTITIRYIFRFSNNAQLLY